MVFNLAEVALAVGAIVMTVGLHRYHADPASPRRRCLPMTKAVLITLAPIAVLAATFAGWWRP